MDSGNTKLDSLFESLSSIYNKDNGMLNSNLYVLLNSYAQVFDDVQRNINQTSVDTYIFSADSDALQDNFGSLINFPKPPRLNSVDNGDNIYRFILATLYQYFLSGATVATMESSLNEVLSLLNIDPSDAGCAQVVNYSQLKFDASSVMLSYPAVKCSGSGIIGIADPNDILIVPSGDLGVTAYDDSTRTVSFTGTVNTGTTYQFLYTRDNSNYVGTNWMNLTDRNVQNVSPMNLSSGLVNTYNNPEFSYWWNTYNVDGSGVVVNEFQITEEDSSLVYRLPSKTVRFLNPYTNSFSLKSYDFYNLTGTSFVLNGPITPTNPDILFSDFPINYQEEVSGRFQNYYVRYNQNNPGPAPVMTQFSGIFTKYTKKFESIEFPSDDFGPLDFFEKNAGFDVNDLFGSGTKHAWVNVANSNGNYTINNAAFVPRFFSLHQDVKYAENFESDNLTRIDSTYFPGTRISESPGTQPEGKQNCLMLISQSTGSTTSVSPIVPSDLLYQPSGINHVEVDFFDAMYTGTSNTIDIIRTGTSNSYHQFRFGMDGNLFAYLYPTGVSTTVSGVTAISSGSGFVLQSGSDIFNSSKGYGFVETYFSSSGSTNYATNQSAAYTLVSGNPNSTFSTTELQPSASIVITPDTDNATIQNMDSMTADFNFNPTGNTIQLDLSFYHSIGNADVFNGPPYLSYVPTPLMPDSPSNKTVGIASYFNSTLPLPHDGSVVSVPFYAQRSFRFYTNPGNQRLYLLFNDHVLDTFKHPVPISASYDTGVDLSIGQNIIEIVKGQYFKLNGVQHVFIKDVAALWEIPANYQSYFNQVDVGSDKSLSLSVTSGITVNHVYFGNKSKKDIYLNNISNAFTNSINNTKANLIPVPVPYFYQTTTVPGTIDQQPKNYIDSLGRQKKWHHLSVDFGTAYSGITATVDSATIFSGNIGFQEYLVNPSGVILSSTSSDPFEEFGYFDNVELSYFDNSFPLNKYQIQLQSDDWEGSQLEQSTIVDNKFFKLEPVANFQFLVTVKGLNENYIYIVNDIINRVKPAYTLAIPIYLLEQSLDTTSQVPQVTDAATDWETGNTSKDIVILPGTITSGSSTDLPGFIGISGLST